MTKIFMFFCIIGFTMPFVTVSCGSETFVTLTGFDVMTGKLVFLLNKIEQTPTDPIVTLAFIACIVTLIAAFLPKYPISRLVWGLSSIGGLLCVGYYIFNAGNAMAYRAGSIVKYEIPANISTMPGSGAVLCAACFIASLVMLVRKLFFEEPDLLVLTPDEREVYEAIKAEEKAEEPEKERLRQELDEKIKPLKRFEKKEVIASDEVAKQSSDLENQPLAETPALEEKALTENVEDDALALRNEDFPEENSIAVAPTVGGVPTEQAQIEQPTAEAETNDEKTEEITDVPPIEETTEKKPVTKKKTTVKKEEKSSENKKTTKKGE